MKPIPYEMEIQIPCDVYFKVLEEDIVQGITAVFGRDIAEACRVEEK